MAKTTNYVSDGLCVEYHSDGIHVHIVTPKLDGDRVIVLAEEIDGLIAELRAVQHCWKWQAQNAKEKATYDRLMAEAVTS